MKPVRVAQDGVRLPLLRDLWTDEDCFDVNSWRPEWNSIEVAEFFFARSKHWMAYHLRQHHDQYRGRSIEIRENGGGRAWRLHDVERFAHGLFERGIIDFAHLTRTVHLVKLVAQQYGFLPYTELDDVALAAIAASDRRGDAARTIALPTPRVVTTAPSLGSAPIRAWAREHGYRVGARGYLSKTVVEAYRRANP